MKKRFKSFRKPPSKKKRVKKHTSDQVAIKRTGDRVIGTIEANLWNEMCEKGITAKHLDMIDRVGWKRAISWLKRQGCDVLGATQVKTTTEHN